MRQSSSRGTIKASVKLAKRWWRLDRWSWSVTDLPATLQELEHSILAKFEPEMPSGTRSCWSAHAQQNAKRLGRPATAPRQAIEVWKLYRAGISKSEIARRIEVGRTAVRRILIGFHPGQLPCKNGARSKKSCQPEGLDAPGLNALSRR